MWAALLRCREKQTGGKGKGKRGQGGAGSKRGREEEGGAQDGQLYYGVGTAEVVPGAAEPETLTPSAEASPSDEPPRGAAPSPHAKRPRRVAAPAIGPSWADTQAVAGQGQAPPAADMSRSLAAAAGDAAEGLPTPGDSHAGESGGQGSGASAATLSGLALALGEGREKQTGGKGKGKRGQGGAGSKRGREEEGGAQDGQLYYGVGTAEVVPGAAEPETLTPSAEASPSDEPPRGAAPSPHAKRPRRVAAPAIGPSWADTQAVAGQGQAPPAADMSRSLAAAAGDAAEGLPTPGDSHAGESGGQGSGASAATLSGLALALGEGEGVPDASGLEAKGATTTMPIVRDAE
eukprot:jgi/Tetstr1/466426/TSEL_010954.t1